MMSQQEKAAWYQLVVIVVAFAAYFALLPCIGSNRATGAFGILGFIGFGHVLFFRRKNGSRVLSDERDHAIQRTALFVALGTFYAVFIAGYLAVLWFFRGRESVPLQVVLSVPWIGFAIVFMAQCVTTIVQYRRGA